MQCLQCQYENGEGLKFCNQCGTPLFGRCAQCGFTNEFGSKFCGECGTSLIVHTPVPGSVKHSQWEKESESQFHVLLRAVTGLLQSERQLTYRELKYVFGLDDALLEDISKTLRFKRLAIDEKGEGLVWTGKASASTSLTSEVAPSPSASVEVTTVGAYTTPIPLPVVTPTATPTNEPTDVSPGDPIVVPEPAHSTPEAERRQLTVMFCDLVGSTDLSGKLDPEDLREVVRAYQETAAEVIERYDGHIAQYLGDGLLIYFGFPVAHEDDAQRAVYTGLGIPEAMTTLNSRLQADYGVQLAVRIGIHTGPVVVGEMGGGGRHENLALGETPNIAARLEGLAQANTAVISPVTAQMVQRSFMLDELGPHELRGVAESMMLYTVVGP